MKPTSNFHNTHLNTVVFCTLIFFVTVSFYVDFASSSQDLLTVMLKMTRMQFASTFQDLLSVRVKMMREPFASTPQNILSVRMQMRVLTVRSKRRIRMSLLWSEWLYQRCGPVTASAAPALCLEYGARMMMMIIELMWNNHFNTASWFRLCSKSTVGELFVPVFRSGTGWLSPKLEEEVVESSTRQRMSTLKKRYNIVVYFLCVAFMLWGLEQLMGELNRTQRKTQPAVSRGVTEGHMEDEWEKRNGEILQHLDLSPLFLFRWKMLFR